MSSTYMKVKLGIRRLVIVDHPVAAPTIGEARKVDHEGAINSDLGSYEGCYNPFPAGLSPVITASCASSCSSGSKLINISHI